MLKSNIQKKLLAIILIFTLTFANFAIVTKAYAASIAETIFGTNSDTGHKNIEFDAYFEAEGNKVTSVISDVNNKDLAIKFDLGVKDSGYLKNAKVELLGSNESKLNFEVEKYEENSITAEKEVKNVEEKIEKEDEIVSKENNGTVEENNSESVILDEDLNDENVPLKELAEVENTIDENSEINNTISSKTIINTVNEVEKETVIDSDETKINEKNNEKLEEIEKVEENIDESAEAIVTDGAEEENIEEPEMIENVFNSEYVQSFDNNVLSFIRINSSSDISIDLPIRYKNEAYVSKEDVSNDVIVRFSGIYVDSQGKEIAVEKEQNLNVSWQDERDVKIESGVTKYIDFGAGVILQTLVRLDLSKTGNRLPIKSTSIEAVAPVLAGKTPNNVVVVANSLEGTTGEKAGEITFNDNNWSYNNEENKIIINVENNEKTVKESEYSEDFLKDDEKDKVGLYNANGTDEYLITYTYSNISIEDIEEITESSIKVKILNMAQGLFNDENSYKYELGSNKGNIVSFNKVNETEEISKVYEYINYNNNDKYEVELADTSVINVSYKDIIKDLKLEDVSNSYINKEGNSIETEDTYYKKVEISKENFDKMLGETGEIKVTDINGNELGKINNSSTINEEENIVLNIEGRYSKLNFEITKPIAEGNIVIRNVKAISNLSIDKSSLINMSKINSKTKLKADYEYVEETVEVEERDVETALKDTYTKANIKFDRDNLSTLSVNENVELRVELNNATEASDIYGHSVFEIELPEYIESLEITNTKMLYGEGLNIAEIVAEGRIIRITVDGKQEAISGGTIANGTNIVINANIKVNLYTPAKKELVKLRYVNDEATNYENNGEDEFEIHYSAPTGLVAVNSIQGYNGDNKIQSVRQGKVVDYIDIFAERKEAEQEIIIMNNNGNEITDVKILGRFPFKSAKDILTGDSLGTTLDAKILSRITSDERNRGNFRIYYSENEEATVELDDSRNGWTEQLDSLDNIKSYLIVPEDNYVMNDTEVLRFTYRFEIPENLNHNENIYGTFMASYKNNANQMITDEKEVADLVGLTTGEGPELKVEIMSNKDKIKEFEELEITIKGKNTGDSKANNIVAIFPIPEEMKHLTENTDLEKMDLTFDNNQVVAKIDELQASEEFEYKVNLVANELDIVEDDQEESKMATAKVQPKLSLEAKDLGATLEVVGNITEIESARLKLEESIINTTSNTFTTNNKFTVSIEAENLSEEELRNVVVTQVLPEELKFTDAYISRYDASKQMEVKIGEGSYDETNKTITYKVDKLSEEETVNLKYTVEVNELSKNNTNSKVSLKSIAKIDNSETVESSELIVNFAIPSISANQTSNITDTYIKDGSTIDYIFTIKNDGSYKVTDFNFTDVMPEGMIVDKVVLKSADEEIEVPSSNNEAIVTGTLEAGQEIIITVTARANYLVGSKEKSISNSATITGSNIPTTKTNVIDNIIESSLDMSRVGISDDTATTDSESGLSSVKNNITKTYRIDGLAWEDTNKDGMRNDNEKLLNGIIVKLVNNETGVIVKTMSTTFDGTYSFANVPNGNYLVIFEYDTIKYGVTTYHKDNVGANLNSDVIAAPIEQDGKIKNVAVTDIININNGSVSGIDIGLMLADSFDLELEKTISKITVQTSNGTTTNTFNNQKLAKAEIASKYVSGATVLVEYNITVKNIGDITGYAKKVVDYLPEGMKFNSSIQSNAENWYTGSDGKLYSTTLANTELKKGESRTIKLVLTKEMTEENTGIVNNLAEIYEDYNIYGVSDRNSTPGNKAQGENDLGSADSVILIKTGETLIYISVIITSILIGTIVVLIIVQKKKSLKNMEGGV